MLLKISGLDLLSAFAGLWKISPNLAFFCNIFQISQWDIWVQEKISRKNKMSLAWWLRRLSWETGYYPKTKVYFCRCDLAPINFLWLLKQFAWKLNCKHKNFERIILKSFKSVWKLTKTFKSFIENSNMENIEIIWWIFGKYLENVWRIFEIIS